jgi:predicted nuclease of predicted toxin-antitoxin system
MKKRQGMTILTTSKLVLLPEENISTRRINTVIRQELKHVAEKPT